MENKKPVNLWDDDESVPPTQDEGLPMESGLTTSQDSAVPAAIDEAFLTSAEASSFLAIKSKSLRALALAGKVTYFRLGRSHRYRKNDLLNLFLRIEAKKE